MLIGTSSKRPSLETIRRIKRALREVLAVSEDAIITVTELACLEEGCAPVETVVGLLRRDAPQLQHKLHKPAETVVAADLVQVCEAWDLEVRPDAFIPFFDPES